MSPEYAVAKRGKTRLPRSNKCARLRAIGRMEVASGRAHLILAAQIDFA